ncbi:ComF family protein [Bordetella flabilis]|nr:ComF family protein [Bordetella flabilis]
MTYWPGLRRLLQRAAGAGCPMCDGFAHGAGLCEGCAADVCATMHPTQPRCGRCALRLPVVDAPCPDCARRPLALAGVVAGFDYESPGDMLIARFKVARQYAMAEVLADLVMRALQAPAGGPRRPGLPCGALPPDTILVPIPASRTSLRRRGFNPAAELARALALRTGLPLRRRWLVCAREGPKQSTLRRAERLQGAIGRYACAASQPARCIALVDDVMTTGSTLHAAALALQAAGVRHIVGLVAARAPVDDGGALAQYRLP